MQRRDSAPASNFGAVCSRHGSLTVIDRSVLWINSLIARTNGSWMVLITEKRLSVLPREVKALVKEQRQIYVGINKARSLKRYPAKSVIHFPAEKSLPHAHRVPVSFRELLHSGFGFVRARVVRLLPSSLVARL